MTTVLSLGGSIVAPDGPDPVFLKSFRELVERHLERDPKRRLILVVGGGGPARLWQKAFREAARPAEAADATAQDWIGVMATRLNAELVKALMGELSPQEVVTDPTAVDLFMGRVLVASGWKPGWSTDYDAVLLAEKFYAQEVVNLSNIEKVYTADPRRDPEAKPLDAINWTDFKKLVGDEWRPGANAPFDPVATKKASALRLRVVCVAGRNLENLEALMEGKPYVGTTIGPD